MPEETMQEDIDYVELDKITQAILNSDPEGSRKRPLNEVKNGDRAARVRAVMQIRDISIEEMAENIRTRRIQISAPVTDILNGYPPFSKAFLREFAKKYSIDQEWMLTGKIPEKNGAGHFLSLEIGTPKWLDACDRKAQEKFGAAPDKYIRKFGAEMAPAFARYHVVYESVAGGEYGWLLTQIMQTTGSRIGTPYRGKFLTEDLSVNSKVVVRDIKLKSFLSGLCSIFNANGLAIPMEWFTRPLIMPPKADALPARPENIVEAADGPLEKNVIDRKTGPGK